MATGKSKVVLDEYKSALADLTFNSKPIINVLTMLAEENGAYGQVIIFAIHERIKQVNVEQKMPALYLLDSILKNIGGEYVSIISKYIVEVFCIVFESATDERQRMQLFKLRNTWTQYIPNKTLYELDVRISKTDPNWPIASPAVTAAQNKKKIHVNPKFLQKTDPVTSSKSSTPAITSNSDTGATKLQSRITKQRYLDEEKRVQEQLKILQAEKLKRDRDQHEQELRQQQQERERVLAEQKRQLEVLRKQQQDLSDAQKNTIRSKSPAQITTKKLSTTISNPKVPKLSDPRLPKSTGKVKSPVEVPNQLKIDTKEATAMSSSKNTSPVALTVLNKIMNSISSKKTKPSAQQLARKRKNSGSNSKDKTSPIESLRNKKPELTPNQSDNQSTKDSQDKIRLHEAEMSQSISTATAPTVVSVSPATQTKQISSKDTNVQPASQTSMSVSGVTPPLPFTSTFTQLSNRDMQIAAQAAAIATAMHQMQSGVNSPMAPEQSALIAAQLIKVMQENSSTSTVSSSVTNTVISTTASTVTASKLSVSSHREKSLLSNQDTGNQEQSKEVVFNDYISKDNNSKKPKTKETNREPDRPQEGKGINQDERHKKSRSKSPDRSRRSRLKGNNREKNSSNKSEKESQDQAERSRKARARSPSRYYCRVEKKIEVDKRVEKKEKELVLQRIRKDSGGDVAATRKMSENIESGDHHEIEIDDDLDDIELPEVENNDVKGVDSSKVVNKEPVEVSAGVKPAKMTEHEWEELVKIRKKEYVILRTKILDIKRHRNERRLPVDPEHILKLQDSAQLLFKEGKLSTEQTDELLHQVTLLDFGKSKVNQENEYLHWRSKRHSPPFQSSGQAYDRRHNNPSSTERPLNIEGIPDNRDRNFYRDSPPPQNRLGPPGFHHNEGQLQLKNNRLQPPPHLRDGVRPHHMRESPLPPHMREGPPQHMRDDLPPPHMRDGPPHHMRDGPPPPHMRDGPLPRMRDGPPPQHMRDGPPPQHMRDGPPPPHMRDGPPPQHMRDGPPPQHMRDGPPPPHMRDGPLPHMRDGPPPPSNMRDGPPPQHIRDGPPPHMRDGPLPPMGDGPPHQRIGPPHMRDGPPLRDGPPPPHLRDGPPPPHSMLDGPRPHTLLPQHQLPHNRGGPQLRPTIDGPPPRQRMDGPVPRFQPSHGLPPPFRNDRFPPPNMLDGPRPTTGPLPPHMRGAPPMQMRERQPFPQNNVQPEERPQFNQIAGQMPFENQFNKASQPETSGSLDVSGLLGQLLAAGVLNNAKQKQQEPVDLNAPQMKFKIDELRKRHQSIINHLFQGLQCSSCGQRFPEEDKQQYSDHLDWHFRQNRKEKDGIRKVSSRAWFYDIHDWIEYDERKVGVDGRVQSEFFESEKEGKTEGDTDPTLPESPSKQLRKAAQDYSVPVSSTDNGVCAVCLEDLEQFWDEDREEWRFRDSLREDGKVYHRHCFTDFVPFEFDEVTTPNTTSATPLEKGLDLSALDSTINESIKEEPTTPKSPTFSVPANEDDSAETSIHESVTVKNEPKEVAPGTSDLVQEIGESSIEMDSLKKESEEDFSEDINADNGSVTFDSNRLDIECPNSPEYPVISGSLPRSLSDAKLTDTYDELIPSSTNEANTESLNENVPVKSIGMKRLNTDIACDIATKEIKLESNDDYLYTSFETKQQCDTDINVKVEPSITEVQPNLKNKFDNEAD